MQSRRCRAGLEVQVWRCRPEVQGRSGGAGWRCRAGCGGPRLLQGGQPAASETFPGPFHESRLTGWKNSLWDLSGGQGPEPSPGHSQTQRGQEAVRLSPGGQCWVLARARASAAPACTGVGRAGSRPAPPLLGLPPRAWRLLEPAPQDSGVALRSTALLDGCVRRSRPPALTGCRMVSSLPVAGLTARRVDCSVGFVRSDASRPELCGEGADAHGDGARAGGSCPAQPGWLP